MDAFTNFQVYCIQNDLQKSTLFKKRGLFSRLNILIAHDSPLWGRIFAYGILLNTTATATAFSYADWLVQENVDKWAVIGHTCGLVIATMPKSEWYLNKDV